MKTILDLFGNFSKNETDLQALNEYVKIITTIFTKDASLKEKLVKDVTNNALALDTQGKEEIAAKLRNFLHLLN